MMGFIIENLATIVIGILLLLLIIFAIKKIIHDKKKGKCCGCSSGCTSGGKCHRMEE